MKLKDVINVCRTFDCISIKGVCDEYQDDIEDLKTKKWYKEAKDAKVTCIGTYINGLGEAELWIDIEDMSKT